MDRKTIYPGQIPLETDQLQQSQNTMVGLAKLSAAVLGTSAIATGSGATVNAIVNGFTCTPTAPASLNVIVTAGEIYQLENLEQSTWSSLSADTTHSILKQGILLDPVTFGITPPGTVGYSQSFLIEAQYSDTDSGSTVLPYFNSSNPTLPWSGPGNAGTAQNTVRKGVAAVQVKAGTAATTGTQTVPSPDAGWVGLYVVTVANGASTITSGNITTYSSAPFIPVPLPNVPNASQSGGWTYAGQTSSSGNAFSCTLSPVPTALTVGMVISMKMNAVPLGASTLNVNGLGAQPMVSRGGRAIGLNDWNANDFLSWEWTGSAWMACSFLQGDIPGGVPLQANADWYVNPTTGSDTLYDGTSATVSGSHGPFATLQKAANKVPLYNLNGFSVTIHCAAGSYAPVTLQKINGAGTVTFLGDVTTMSNCTITGVNRSCILAANVNGNYIIHGFKLTASGSSSSDAVCGVNASGSSSSITIGNTEFGACVGAHFALSQGAVGGNVANCVWNISGGCTGNSITDGSFITCYGSAIFQSASGGQPAVTVLNAVTYAGSFVESFFNSFCQFAYASLSGGANVTGKRYSAAGNGVISVSGGSTTYYPGTVAGTTATGGQYG